MEWTENGMEWRKEKSGLEMEWKWKKGKGKKVNWEDEWIMIPPTPLEPPVACDDWPYFFQIFLIYLVYNRWEDKDEERGERRRGER